MLLELYMPNRSVVTFHAFENCDFFMVCLPSAHKMSTQCGDEHLPVRMICPQNHLTN